MPAMRNILSVTALLLSLLLGVDESLSPCDDFTNTWSQGQNESPAISGHHHTPGSDHYYQGTQGIASSHPVAGRVPVQLKENISPDLSEDLIWEPPRFA
jgi:hypothetical protein